MNEDALQTPTTGPDKSREGNEKIDLKILIAEDEEGMRGLLKIVLSTKYTSVETVNDGQSLVDKLKELNYKADFIITDNTMPRLTGLEAVKMIRKMEHLKDTPIIMCTTETNELRKETKDLNVVFVSKPFLPQVLLDAIEQLRQKK